MANYRHVIRQAYADILQRDADQGGLDVYNNLMNLATNALTEAQVRESLLRSEEYRNRFPDQAPPPPPPPAGSLAPLGVVDGNRFGAAGRRLDLFGMVLCCSSDTPGVPDEAVSRGWPAVVDDATLELMAAHKINLTHVRVGPFIDKEVFGDGETAESCAYHLVGGQYDLTRWNEAFWARLRHCLAKAQSLGIYVQIDLVDCWVLEHNRSPWNPARNVNGFSGGHRTVVDGAPHPEHEAWVREVVRRTREFTCVIYQDGNEAWEEGGASREWVGRLVRIVREETATDAAGPGFRLFGTNTGRPGDGVDYLTFHEHQAHGPEALPVMVNEYPTQSPSAVLAQVQIARDNGTVYFYWPGGHTWPVREQVLAGMKQIAEGGSPMPDHCPFLVRMGAKVHNVMDGAHRQLDDRIPVVGGYVVFDLTPRFSHDQNDSRGLPCNNERNVVCGGRPCEDPRGGIWNLVEGSAPIHLQEHGFQCKVGPLPAGGTYTVSIDPPPNYTDGLGKPVRVGPAPSRTASFTVGVPA